MEKLDFVVVGAGWYGLAAAKQYHVLHPEHTMAVLDYASSIGGVWASHRLYPGLKSNNQLGTYEYPDFPMDPSVFGIQPRQHPTGHAIHDYFEAYAKKFGIAPLVRCGTRVVAAEHQDGGGWVLTVRRVDDDGVEGEETKIFTKRLVVASGFTSQPFLPHIRGQEVYGRPLFHSKDFPKHVDTIDPAKSKRVTVFGATKFGWDAAYAYATKGIQVDWIIRPTGHGACWMAPPFVTPLKKWLEKLVNIRFLTWFSQCIWSKDGGYSGIRSFYHGTAIGRAITDTFWSILGGDVIELNGFDKHPELKKLKPRVSAMFTGCSFSILNYETDFFELVRNGTIKIHEADITGLAPGEVHLDDGTVLQSDAFVCVTGWKSVPPLRFLPEGIDKALGMPHLLNVQDGNSSDFDAEDLASDMDLAKRADAEILERFPRLAKPPTLEHYIPLVKQDAFTIADGDPMTPSAPQTPMMLYRFVVPAAPQFLRAKDIAFAGSVANFSNTTCAFIQGLWISAYFDGKLVRDPSRAAAPGDGSSLALEELKYETVLFNRFGRFRYPLDHGCKQPDFVFEALPYLDMLMADMGLRVHRKGGWFSEMTSPYGPEDYADIVEEWKAKYDK